MNIYIDVIDYIYVMPHYGLAHRLIVHGWLFAMLTVVSHSHANNWVKEGCAFVHVTVSIRECVCRWCVPVCVCGGGLRHVKSQWTHVFGGRTRRRVNAWVAN